MSLKTALINLAGSVGKCQENARSLKQCLELGLIEASKDANEITGAMSAKKLWVNANPASAFPATDVTVNNAEDFDAFIVGYSHFTWSGIELWLVEKSAINDNANHTILLSYVDDASGTVMRDHRPMKLTQAEDSSSLVFKINAGARETISTYGTAGTGATKNDILIPEIIFGIKF